MGMGITYLQGIEKAVEYSVPVAILNSDSVLTAISSTTIYKDGGSGATPTNALVHMGSNVNTLTLTATEMDADEIVIVVKDTATPKGDGVIVIKTGIVETATPTSTNYSADLLAFITTSVDLNFSLRKLDFNSSVYNYYGFAKTSSNWVIVRENKSTFVLGYATKQSGVNDKRFLQAFSARTSLTYSGSAPF